MMRHALRQLRCIALLSALLGLASPIELRAQSRLTAATTNTVAMSDQRNQTTDPALDAAARQYFPSDAEGVPNKRIFRLTRDQLDATTNALLPGYVTQSIKVVIPRDALQTNYEYAELLSFNPANISGLSKWIADIAVRVRRKPDGVINCAATGDTTACLAAAAQAFVVKAFRGDVTEATSAQYNRFFLDTVKTAGVAQATGDLVEVVLNSPNFLFRREVDVNRNHRLSPTQLLQSVTYTMADAPPEAFALRSGSAAQYLRTGPEASATIGTIMASPAAREKLVRFFMAWLEIKEPDEFTISQKVFPEFTPTLAAAMRAETRQFLRTHLSRANPSLKDITQATQSFVPQSLAPLYGGNIRASSGSTLVDLNPAQRLGIFSHPAVLASHSGPTDTRPIKRGVFWVRKAMCMEMEPPPKDLHAKLYDLVGATERQRIEHSTSGPACAGCHKVINPFAFFQENYDALGRWRTEDKGQAIDASILINFLDEEPIKTTTSVEALKVLTSSMMFKQCFVRQLFRFYMGRTEEPSDDPLLRRLFVAFADQDHQDIVRTVQLLTASDRIVKRQ
jgi:hypothetical protein